MRRSSIVECRASNWKVAKPWFDFRCGSVSLCPWERHLMLLPTWGQAVYPLWWLSLSKTCKQNSFCAGVIWQTQNI